MQWIRAKNKLVILANCLTVYLASFSRICRIFSMLCFVVVIAGRPLWAASYSCWCTDVNRATHLQIVIYDIWPCPKISQTSRWISTGFKPSTDLPLIYALISNTLSALLPNIFVWSVTNTLQNNVHSNKVSVTVSKILNWWRESPQEA